MENLPVHLRKYIVEQDSSAYSSLEHSSWRFILYQLRHFLKDHAHSSYLDGLEKTGIRLDRIPSIPEISRSLEKYGWRALPVSGFIPPAAFMELQSLGVLPIAREMRSYHHMMYTPAPDIVHEAAGHAPMIINPEYSGYLQDYAAVARRAILNKEDLEVYRAIRWLSDVKEDPQATSEAIQQAERALDQAVKSQKTPSEATWLSRMNWWTAEYGLIGDMREPKIFGAGLLSSVGEAQSCLGSTVKKIPLTIDCIHYSYDITEPQPQLFVTPSFEFLREVLNELRGQMAFVRGGRLGVVRALRSGMPCSLRFDSGIEVGGVVQDAIFDDRGELAWFRCQGPTQLAWQERVWPDQGVERHQHGFSSPVGMIEGWTVTELSEEALKRKMHNGRLRLRYRSGFEVEGEYVRCWLAPQSSLVKIITLKDARVFRGSEMYYQPEWGEFDLILGDRVVSVWGGAPDRSCYPEGEDFFVKRVEKVPSQEEQERVRYFDLVQDWYDKKKPREAVDWEKLSEEYHQRFGKEELWDWEMSRIRAMKV